MKREIDWIELGAEAPLEIAHSGRSLAADEIGELVALAIKIARERKTPFDDLWLELTPRGQQRAVHLFALRDNLTCMIDIHEMSCGVALANNFFAKGIRIPWIFLQTGMSPSDQPKGVASGISGLAQALDEDGNEGWRTACRKSSCVFDDQSTPLPIREFWRAILECRREDAIQILNQLEKE